MQVDVRTTQNVSIQYPIASIGDRILAYIIDMMIILVIAIMVLVFYFNTLSGAPWVVIVLVVMPLTLYHLLFEIFMNGQSPGKRALDIRVVRLNGTPATVGDYLIRWVFALVDIQLMSGLIAVIAIVAGGKGQRVGDMVAGTTVVKLGREMDVNAREVFVAKDANYTPVFTQVVQLSESDIELVQRALEVNRDSGNSQPMMAVTEKIKTLLVIQTDLPPAKFLYTIIRDFQHITSR